MEEINISNIKNKLYFINLNFITNIESNEFFLKLQALKI